MIALEQALRIALLHFVWQGAAVAFVLWIALVRLRNHSANARYLASCGALAALVALPLITISLIYGRAATFSGIQAFAEAAPIAGIWSSNGFHAPERMWFESLQSWALPVWLVGVALFSLRFAWGSRQIGTLRRSGSPADESVIAVASKLAARLHIARPVQLLTSSLAEVPSVVGWIRPAILLPAATIAGLTPEQFESVLAHELAHIRRHDYLVNLLQMLVETVLFYHPAVWWISSRMRYERELCCDDLAVKLCGDPICYARALTRLERLRPLAPKMALGSTDGPLFYRIQRLLGGATRRFGPSRLPSVLILCLLFVCVAACFSWVRAHAQDKQPAPTHPWTKVAPSKTPAVADAPGVRVDLGGAAIVKREPVDYPRSAIDDEIEGRVEVEVKIDSKGNVEDAQVARGPEELRDAVLDSVRKWTFQSSAGHAINIKVSFHLPEVVFESDDRPEAAIVVDSDDDADCDTKVEIPSLEEVMNDVSDSLQEAEKALEEAESELKDKTLDLSSELEDAQRQLESAGDIAANADLVDGRVLKHLRFLGLSEETRADLLKRLPLHEGDKLTREVLEKVNKALHDIDPHLYCVTVPVEDDDAAVLIRRK